MKLSQKVVQDVLTDPELWDEISAHLRQSLATTALRTVLGGASAAESVGVIADFDILHPEALYVVRTWLPAWWAQLETTTRAGLRSAIEMYVELGLGKRGLPDLINAIEPLFGPARAKRIAATETTRLFAEGNQMAAMQDDTIGGLMWLTAKDSLVCPICGPRHGLIYPKANPPDCPAHPN